MIVVANTSPLVNLDCIGQSGLLQRLFSTVLIPSAVATEISRLSATVPRFRHVKLPGFVKVIALQYPATAAALMVELDAGEAEALALAVESKANLVLLDERRGRRIADRLGLGRLGLMGLLTLAKRRGIIPAVAPLLQRLEAEAGFWVSPALRARVLTAAGEQP